MTPVRAGIACASLLVSGALHAHEPVIAVGAARDISIDVLSIRAPGVDTAPLRVRVLRWRDDCIDLPCPVLYLNDGQDLDAVGVAGTVDALRRAGGIGPLLVVAIDMPRDRLGAYGLSDRAHARSVMADSSVGPIGTHAHAYARWVVDTLVPRVDAGYRTQREPSARAVLGWSLGGAQAFDMAWQWPEVFGRVGAFSPSFWLASDRSNDASRQRTRLAQSRVDATAQRPPLKVYLAVGNAEEDSDRDGDGINDALDDTRDLVDGWQVAAGGPRGLRQLGYRIDATPHARDADADVALDVVPGGTHSQSTWARMLSGFLRWHFGPEAGPQHPPADGGRDPSASRHARN